MIVQCDECKAKFRLDESRIGANGAKVRCSKCRHVFMVHPPQASEEESFDFLDGLGTGAEEAGAAASASAVSTADPFQHAESELPARFTPEVERDLTSDAASQEIATSGMDTADDNAFEFGDDLLGGGSAAEPSAPAGEFDFSDLNPPPEETEDSGFAGSGSEFDFSGESPAATSGPPADEWGEDREDFFGGEAGAAAETPAEGAPGGGQEQFAEHFDFEGFGDEVPSTPVVEEPVASAVKEEFDFGPLPTDPSGDEQATPDFSFDTTFPSFDLEPSHPVAEPQSEVVEVESATGASAEQETPFAGFGDDGDSRASLFSEEEPAPPSDFSFDFGDAGTGAGHEEEKIGATDVQWDISAPAVKEDASPDLSAGDAALRGLAESFEAPSTSQEPLGIQEELPPLSIASRRKQSALMPVLAALVAIAVIGGIGGAGYYLYNGGTAAFDRLGLGFVTKWLGWEGKDEGAISVNNVSGSFTVNKESGEIFVVSGQAVNNYRKSRASLQVKAVLYGKDGKVLAQKTVFCGNAISGEQVKVLPWSKIEAAMSNQFGDSLVNLGVAPGKGIPFVVVFSQVPKDVVDFAVEAAGSTVAGQ